MAMYVFRELSPKIFYFTYSLQEPELYIDFVEESESNNSDLDIISKWNPLTFGGNPKVFGSEKILSSDFSKKDLPIDSRNLYLINTLKATFHHCFSQYRLYTNIEEPVNLDTTYSLKKYTPGFLHTERGGGKYVAYFFLNDNYSGGHVTFPGTNFALSNEIKPEKGSVIIMPSENEMTSTPTFNADRYVAVGTWV